MTQHANDQDDINALLRRLDHEPPRVDATEIIARAGASGGARPWRLPIGAKAAGILLALTVAGAAYAIPGSPVRGWINSLIARISGTTEPPSVTPTPNTDAPRAGITVPPGNALVIRFSAHQPTGDIRVRLTDETEVAVAAYAGAASFTTGTGGLDVDNRGSSATFEVRIPRAAPMITIEVEGVGILVKRGARIDAPAPPDSAGVYVLSLNPTGRSSR